jgi:ABC-type iron transport system FetAB permease component
MSHDLVSVAVAVVVLAAVAAGLAARTGLGLSRDVVVVTARAVVQLLAR